MNEKICAICGVPIKYGNNPDPIEVDGEVCDECNQNYVIPARLDVVLGKRNKATDSVQATWLCKNWPEDVEDRKQMDQKLRQLNLSKKLTGKDANIIGSKSQIEKLMMWMGINKSRFSEIKTVEKANDIAAITPANKVKITLKRRRS